MQPLFKDGLIQFRSGNLLMVNDPADCDCCDIQTCCVAELDGVWPSTVNVAVTNVSDCACLAQEVSGGYTFLGYDGFLTMCDGSSAGFSITCESDQWYFSTSSCRCSGSSGNYPGELISCDPLHIVFNSIELCSFGNAACCDGFISVEVTE